MTAPTSVPVAQVATRGASAAQRALKRFTRNRRAIAGGVVLLVMASLAIFAPFITPHNPIALDLRNRNQPPSSEHILGTDQFGRDLFSRIIHGGQVSLVVGMIAVGIGLGVGGLMGVLAAFYGEVVDNLTMRIADVLLAMPGLLLALAIVAALGPGNGQRDDRGGDRLHSHLRADNTQRGLDRARAGLRQHRPSGRRRRLADHVPPRSAQLGRADHRPDHAEPGRCDSGRRRPQFSRPWNAASHARVGQHDQRRTPLHPGRALEVTFPGIAILITVLALNLVGDGLRDALDPRHSADG